MRIFFSLKASIVLLAITGCVGQNSNRTDWFNKSIAERRWADAFMWYSNVLKSGTEVEKEKVTTIAKQYPQIAQAGAEEFSAASIQKQVAEKSQLDNDVWFKVSALCTLISEEQCKSLQERVGNAVSNLKPEAIVLNTAFEKLTAKEQEKIKERYDLRLYDADTIGLVAERQVQNISTQGSATGSEVGSSLASAVYVNRALSSGSYNMWTDIAVGVLGGVAGAGGNRAPVQQYIVNYTVRTLDNKLKSVETIQPSAIGEPIGSCFSLQIQRAVDSEFCSMTVDDIRKKYLTD